MLNLLKQILAICLLTHPVYANTPPQLVNRIFELQERLQIANEELRSIAEKAKRGTYLWDPASRCDGRLTLTTAVPVTTSDVTGAGTLYFTPYQGNTCALYDGSNWTIHSFTERSLSLSIDTTTTCVYDVFLYSNSGTLTLETLKWTNNTTRATAITLQDGVYVKSGATTRRYLGTICASGSNTTEDSTAKRYVWNYYNRVRRGLVTIMAAGSYSYLTGAWRAMNNSTANSVAFVLGVNEVPVQAMAASGVEGTLGTNVSLGVGLDSTTVNSALLYGAQAHTNRTHPIRAQYSGYPGIGYHYLQVIEYGGGAAMTWALDFHQLSGNGIMGSLDG